MGTKIEIPYLKALLEKLFQTFYYSLKNSFEKIEFQNNILYLFKPMQTILQRNIFKMIYVTRGCITKNVF
jgi:hypothetical protein